MKFSIQYKGFLIFAGLVLVFNLLVMNDFTSALEGPEVNNIYLAQKQLDGFFPWGLPITQLPMSILVENYESAGFNLFLLRLPNVLIFLLTLIGFFLMGKRLFGKGTILLTLLVISSTYLVVSATKFVAFDTWLLAFQLMSFLSLILLLKQPVWKWRTLFWLFTILAININPTSSLVFSIGMWMFLVFAHSKGKSLLTVFDIIFVLLMIPVVYLIGGSNLIQPGLFFHYASSTVLDYFKFNLIGILPWIAFLPASLWDLFQKLRKREEMAIISFAFLLFSILSYGLILQIALVFLIAKQVENYFKPNYPYTDLVKSFAVLNLVFSFFLVAYFLLTGYDQFGEIGFRSRMGVCGFYWAFGFLAVIGLFGNNKKMIIGGFSLSGMLAMTMFWAQVNPLLENYRNLPLKIVDSIEEITPENEKKVFLHQSFYKENSIDLPERIAIYMRGKNIEYGILKENESISDKKGVFVLNDSLFTKLDTNLVEIIEKIPVNGRNGIFEKEQQLWVLKN